MSVENPYYVYIDSRKRLSGTDSNFSYQIQFSPDQDYTHITLLNALIPKSYYLIPEHNNTFQLQEGLQIVSIDIPIGNYFLQAWQSTLSSLLTANSPNGWVYNVTYPAATGADTGKLRYSVTNNTSQPSIIVSSLFEPFGFFMNTTNTFINDSLNSTTVINLQSETRLLLHCSLVNNPAEDNVLISINATSNVSFSTISYINYAPEYRSHRITSQLSQTVSFSLTDESGNILDLNGLNMNLTLMFFKKDPINDIIRNYLKMQVLKDNSHIL